MFLKLKTNLQIPYPVGSDMIETMPIVKDMAEKFDSLYRDKKTNVFVLLVRGSSGAIISGIFTAILPDYKFRIQHIKKEGESSHNRSFHSVCVRKPTYIIVDDFMSSGETINKIYGEAAKKVKRKDFIVDTLILSGFVQISKLYFEFNNIISGSIE